MRQLSIILLSFMLFSFSAHSQKLSVQWEELTAGEFASAVKQSEGVCVIPMGVMEKHGQHLPLGTDVYTARGVALKAAEKEYCIVYPYYFAGQIFEAKQQPGTIAYSPELIFKLLEETCEEIARNGIKKIILMNSHGGNPNFLQFFCQSQLAKQKDYAVYLFTPSVDDETEAKITKMLKSERGFHGDEVETSLVMAIRPDLVKPERAKNEPGTDMNRLQLDNVYTGIWWYSKFPNHYAGEAQYSSAALGKVRLDQYYEQLAKVIKDVKADKATLRLQDEFFKESLVPLDTKVK